MASLRKLGDNFWTSDSHARTAYFVARPSLSAERLDWVSPLQGTKAPVYKDGSLPKRGCCEKGRAVTRFPFSFTVWFVWLINLGSYGPLKTGNLGPKELDKRDTPYNMHKMHPYPAVNMFCLFVFLKVAFVP